MSADRDELLDRVAVALHDAECPDRKCSGPALGAYYRQADIALGAARPAIAAQAAAAERECWTREAIIARLAAKYGPHKAYVSATLVTLALVAVAAARMGLLTVRLGPPAKPRTPKPKDTTP